MPEPRATEIGVDVGGTFTDLVIRRTGEPDRILKVPTSSADPAAAILATLDELAAAGDLDMAGIARFVHGTTVATNLVLERKGAPVGLITTRGFKDVLELGRQMRHQMYELALQPETPTFLAPGSRRHTVAERLSPDGEVLTPLDEAELRQRVRACRDQGAQAIAVVFLFAFVNPVHERRAREIIREEAPELMVSLSHEVDPSFREYERSVATAFDAYIKPAVDRYLDNLASGLRARGIPAPLQVMQSRGGVAAEAVARQRPIRLFLSGPAAGVIGGRAVGDAAAEPDVISFDVGGTSCDIALVSAGKPLIRPEGRIESFPVRTPMVDVNAIGAGGGSVAWVDGSGSLRVGPHSAGSTPGPACYGRGGREATVTDASIVLGYIDPAYFAGGSLSLAPDRAHEAVAELAQRTGMGAEELALGIHRVVNAQMAEGLRLVSIRQGFDPRDFALIPLGGAGGLHACALARELGMRRILVPRHPGVLSASGLLDAPVEHEASTAFPQTFAASSRADIQRVLAGLDARCRELMAAEAIGTARPEVRYSADVCFVGQSHHLEVPIDPDSPEMIERLYDNFLGEHERVFGHSFPAPGRFVNLRAVHRVASNSLAEPPPAATAQREAARRRIRLPAPFGTQEATVVRRETLQTGQVLAGPAIVEQEDTTVLIEPDWQAEAHSQGHLVVVPT
jgi:N-methylhydantoinase A/oxoprolinase/acetone carboxylase beta subunit